MPVYALEYVVSASTTRQERLTIEGDYLTDVYVSFPEGSHGLLRVRIYYGEKQIVPYIEGEYLAGNADRYSFSLNWPLPESPCDLVIEGENQGTKYEHRAFIMLVTQYFDGTIAGQVSQGMKSALRSTFGVI